MTDFFRVIVFETNGYHPIFNKYCPFWLLAQESFSHPCVQHQNEEISFEKKMFPPSSRVSESMSRYIDVFLKTCGWQNDILAQLAFSLICNLCVQEPDQSSKSLPWNHYLFKDKTGSLLVFFTLLHYDNRM